MSLRTYYKIENNEKSPTLEELNLIASKLGVSSEELIYGEPKIVFENCNQKMFFNNGTIHYQSPEELKAFYDKRILEQKVEIIFLRKQVEMLQKTINKFYLKR